MIELASLVCMSLSIAILVYIENHQFDKDKIKFDLLQDRK